LSEHYTTITNLLENGKENKDNRKRNIKYKKNKRKTKTMKELIKKYITAGVCLLGNWLLL
jgi:hypothetical protein